MNIQQNQTPQDTEKLKEIPKLVRKYAQNRTLAPYVLIVIIISILMPIVFLITLTVIAFMKEKVILAGVSIALLVSILIFLIIFVSKFGGKNCESIGQCIDQWIYGKEGAVSMPQAKLTRNRKWLEFVAGVVWIICLIGTMYLSKEGYIASKYQQPVTAIYYVPFLVYLYVLQRTRFGPLVLICPILYTVHAILIVVGVPIYFTGEIGIVWNMFLPVAGYTFLAHVISHLYNRYTLKKLKGITRLESDTANGN